MGCGGSKQELRAQQGANQLHLRDHGLNEDALETKGHLAKAYQTFKNADKDRNGRLDQNEFARAFCLEDNPYVYRLFQLFDADNNRTVDFPEFLNGMALFHRVEALTKQKFCFRLLDLDGSGTFDLKEVMEMVHLEKKCAMLRHKSKQGQSAWGDKSKSPTAEVDGRFKKFLEEIRARPRGEPIRINDFIGMFTRYPQVFYPCDLVFTAMAMYSEPAFRVVEELREKGVKAFQPEPVQMQQRPRRNSMDRMVKASQDKISKAREAIRGVSGGAGEGAGGVLRRVRNSITGGGGGEADRAGGEEGPSGSQQAPGSRRRARLRGAMRNSFVKMGEAFRRVSGGGAGRAPEQPGAGPRAPGTRKREGLRKAMRDSFVKIGDALRRASGGAGGGGASGAGYAPGGASADPGAAYNDGGGGVLWAPIHRTNTEDPFQLRQAVAVAPPPLTVKERKQQQEDSNMWSHIQAISAEKKSLRTATKAVMAASAFSGAGHNQNRVQPAQPAHQQGFRSATKAVMAASAFGVAGRHKQQQQPGVPPCVVCSINGGQTPLGCGHYACGKCYWQTHKCPVCALEVIR